ncbi:MAG: PorT family protein [Chitinophagia bacterium]|nr:PorT family protein [Chitinophagia bacterium]
MNIRTLFCFLLLLLCLRTPVSAQLRGEDIVKNTMHYDEWGIKGGVHLGQISSYLFPQGFNTGGVLGAYLSHHGEIWGIRGEINFNNLHLQSRFPASQTFAKKKYQSSDTVTKAVFDLVYINVPVLAEIRIKKHFCMMMGAQYSYQAVISDANGAYKCMGKPEDLFKKGNVSMLVGMESDSKKGIKIGGLLCMGMDDLNNGAYRNLTDRWSNIGAQVYLMYRMKKWNEKEKK